MELAKGGELFDRIVDHGPFPEDSARAPMERAMKAVIGFDDSDAKRLEAKKAEHAKRALGGLAVFFGGSG